jgi:hypothetical protein
MEKQRGKFLERFKLEYEDLSKSWEYRRVYTVRSNNIHGYFADIISTIRAVFREIIS